MHRTLQETTLKVCFVDDAVVAISSGLVAVGIDPADADFAPNGELAMETHVAGAADFASFGQKAG